MKFHSRQVGKKIFLMSTWSRENTHIFLVAVCHDQLKWKRRILCDSTQYILLLVVYPNKVLGSYIPGDGNKDIHNNATCNSLKHI